MWNFEKKYEFGEDSYKSCFILTLLILLIGIYVLGFLIVNIILIILYIDNYENFIDDMDKLYKNKLIYLYFMFAGIITIIIYKILESIYIMIKRKNCNIIHPL
jgi:hypothetical protein